MYLHCVLGKDLTPGRRRGNRGGHAVQHVNVADAVAADDGVACIATLGGQRQQNIPG